jgi:hypothetical protein
MRYNPGIYREGMRKVRGNIYKKSIFYVENGPEISRFITHSKVISDVTI